MTENEAREFLGRFSLDRIGYASRKEVDTERFNYFTEVLMTAMQALTEIQQYRAIETELRERYHANVDIKELMKCFIETIFKGEKHEGFCILTNQDAKIWEEYRAIGTVEECREAMERQKVKDVIYNPDGGVDED